jgi:hypothetical protein
MLNGQGIFIDWVRGSSSNPDSQFGGNLCQIEY